jgi:hypothetical protein
MKRGEAAIGIRRCRSWLVLPALLFSLGCGSPKGDVSGKVTYQNKPLTGGTVTFFGAENRVVGSVPISDEGDYSMANVPVGPVKITVAAPPIIIGDTAGTPPPLSKGKGGKRGSKNEAKKRTKMRESLPRVEVPAKYKMPEQSGLTYTVEPGKQVHAIGLK